MGERTGNIAETFKETQANADNADIRVMQKDSHLLYCYRNGRIALFFFFLVMSTHIGSEREA